jgi:hypothetical protein
MPLTVSKRWIAHQRNGFGRIVRSLARMRIPLDTYRRLHDLVPPQAV